MSDEPASGGSNGQADDSASLEDRVHALEKRVQELGYVIYKLLYEMGGKEILEKDRNHPQ